MKDLENRFEIWSERLYSEVQRFNGLTKMLMILHAKVKEHPRQSANVLNVIRIAEYSLAYNIVHDINRLLLEKRGDASTIRDFVVFAQTNIGLFSIKAIKNRLVRPKTNPLLLNVGIPTKKEFIALLDCLDNWSQKLAYLKEPRDKYYAHLSNLYLTGSFEADPPIDLEEIDVFAEDLWCIYVKISCWYRGSTHLAMRIASDLDHELNYLFSRLG